VLATLAVVAYACLLSNDSAMRVRVILQGAEVILLTWAAGFIASARRRTAMGDVVSCIRWMPSAFEFS